jgi:hypothetical protein
LAFAPDNRRTSSRQESDDEHVNADLDKIAGERMPGLRG